jgi:inhibitor of cysteine peptidase
MQSEIKKRTRIYGAVAVLLAIVLASLCYNLGYMPNFQASAPLFLKTFSTYAELRDFLVANSKTQGTYPFFGPWDTNLRNTFADTYGKPATLNVEYSTTNIQVAGVDEADIVKTDGEYIYVMTGNNVSILKGYPPAEAQLVSKITLNDTNPTGIFASGNRLVVLGCKYTVPSVYYGSYFVDVKTLAKVYDISNRADPQLLRTFTISGNYFNSRMIDKYVYFVVSQPAYVIYDTVILPKIYSDTDFKEISPSEIHYSSASDDYYLFTTFAALNIQDTAEEPTYMTLMLGGTSNMYVSLNNIYVTYPEPEEKTSIYRIHINNRNLTSEASGKVSGRELNQFSMDEYNDFFRIATTTRMNGITQNNLYVLDMNLSIIGKIEDIATN